ncbi:MAG: hypothetical protein KJP06_07400, partial [Deltaproteobacteria bacterium]|nr:hypothetical protein [Deltaproteobacteria bacterium]
MTKSEKKKWVAMQPDQQALLRELPGVDYLLNLVTRQAFAENIPHAVVVKSIRSVIESRRQQILASSPT